MADSAAAQRSGGAGAGPMMAFGLALGLAFALLRIAAAVAQPARWAAADGILLRLSLFFLPLAWYGAVGLGLGVALALLKRFVAGRWGSAPWSSTFAGLVAALAVASLVLVGLDLPRDSQRFSPGGWFAFVPVALAGLGLLAWAAWKAVAGELGRSGLPAAALLAPGSGVVALGAALAGAWLAGDRPVERWPPPAGAPETDRPDVVLVTWDTVRADLLPLYGGSGLETPDLDALAARSVVFDQMVAVAPITGPAHASLLTGLMPPTHGLRSNCDTRLAASVPTLAEQLAAGGYDTAAFVAAFPLKEEFGLGRGFRIYDDRLEGDRLVDLARVAPHPLRRLVAFLSRFAREALDEALPGRLVVERATAYIGAAPRPFFLWVHFYDAHGPHDPPPALRRRAEELSTGARPVAPDRERGAPAMLLQRGEIMELDAFLGQLLAALERRDPGLGRTAVFLVADHGECFGEGGYSNTHAPSLFEATQHVPALLHLPGGAAAGRRVPDLVSQVDVPATLCEIACVAPLPEQQGASLLPLALGRGGPPERRWFQEGFYMEAYLTRLRNDEGGDERKIGVRSAEWKYVQRASDPTWFRLYRIADGETADLAAEHADLVARLRAALGRILESMPVAGDTTLELTERASAALAALGYGGGGPDGTEKPAREAAGGPRR